MHGAFAFLRSAALHVGAKMGPTPQDNYKVICALLFLHKDWKYPLCILLMAQLFWVGATCVKLSQYQMPSWTNQKIHSPHLHNLLQFSFKKIAGFRPKYVANVRDYWPTI